MSDQNKTQEAGQLGSLSVVGGSAPEKNCPTKWEEAKAEHDNLKALVEFERAPRRPLKENEAPAFSAPRNHSRI